MLTLQFPILLITFVIIDMCFSRGAGILMCIIFLIALSIFKLHLQHAPPSYTRNSYSNSRWHLFIHPDKIIVLRQSNYTFIQCPYQAK